MINLENSEAGLLATIVVLAFVGYTVHSCNTTYVEKADIELKQHQLEIEHPKVCKDHTVHYGNMITNGGSSCEPGETPSYKNLGDANSGAQYWLFCTCNK